MTELIDVHLLRPVKIGGQVRGLGERLTVPASVAAELISAGRARLIDPADLGVVIDAQAERERGVWRDRRPRWPRMLLRR